MNLLQALEIQQFVRTNCAEIFNDQDPLILESGEALSPVHVAFETYGELNSDGTNAILICHALTANAHAAGKHSPLDSSAGWWEPLIGSGKAFDTDQYFVICPNILGSCYGTTGPSSIDPTTGEQYRLEFPQFTVRDIVSVQKRLLDFLGVNRLVTVAGSSLGGMQVLEWPLMYPGFCDSIIPISTSARQTAWCIALNAASRTAITNDSEWNHGDYHFQPAQGLALARMIGMISYRSPLEFELRFGRQRNLHHYEIEDYLIHQGKKLVERFDANTYLYLTHAMDLHDVTRNRGTLDEVLGSIQCRVCCIGFNTDVRYPVSNQQELVKCIPEAELNVVESLHGHDAFLIEFDALTKVVNEFL